MRQIRPARTRSDTYEQLRQQALEAVASQNLDRDRDTDEVQELIDQLVADYQRDAVHLAGERLANPVDTAARLTRSLLEHGPLTSLVSTITNGTADPASQVVEVEIRGRSISWRSAMGQWQAGEPASEGELRSVIDRMLQDAGAQLTEAEPTVSTQVLDRRVRLTASIPPVSDNLECNLRFYGAGWRSLEDLVDLDTLTPAAASLLRAVMQHRQTGVLVSGRPQAGKTTMANALLRAMPPGHVVSCCEDTRELSAPLPHISYRRTTQHGLDPAGRREITLGRLVELALRSSPDRIVVGEIRGAEAAVLTRAANAGSAVLSTIHADGAADALDALAETALLHAGGHNMPPATVRSRFCRSIDVIVHLDSEDPDLRPVRYDHQPVRRQVMEIAAVSPLQASAEHASVVPIFRREALGAPLMATQEPIPELLARRLDQVVRPHGISADDIVHGREVLRT